jgi:hypothetical protein
MRFARVLHFFEFAHSVFSSIRKYPLQSSDCFQCFLVPSTHGAEAASDIVVLMTMIVVIQRLSSSANVPQRRCELSAARCDETSS